MRTAPLVGLAADRPLAELDNLGLLFYAQDTGVISYSDGITWRDLDPGYKLIHETMGGITQNLANGTYAIYPTTFNLEFAASSTAASAFRYDAGLWAPSGRTEKLRLLVTAIVNATSPGAGVTFRPGLYAVTPGAGATNAITLTLGALVTGSQPAAQGPLVASTSYTWDSGDFDAPATGFKAVGVVVAGGPTAANSTVAINARVLEKAL